MASSESAIQPIVVAICPKHLCVIATSSACPQCLSDHHVLPSQVERAERILHLTLPEIGSHDEAVDHLHYVDPNNDATRLHSIAAALYILREVRKLKRPEK